jgi:hypothetical protein
MTNANPSPQSSNRGTASANAGFAPLQWLKTKRISYFTLPLLVMATITEFVILATGWKYQQVVCLPLGMGVTFFGIGPIGATILSVELLKLPLAIWTASRHGWTKVFMLVVGLPMICLLTFQLVKDMAVYEMGVALTPAAQMLDVATKQEVRISQLNAELATLDQKKADRDRRLAELADKQAKAKAEIEDALKRNDATRDDAINLTDYQAKELSGVREREAAIVQQFDADTAALNKTIADLRARREIEVDRASKWNAEEARLDNEYKAKLLDYENQKAAYEKRLADYDSANFVKREFMKKPVDPGVPPVREANTILKPAEISEIDAQIKAREDELTAVNNKRRDRIAQIESDARQLRGEYDQRSTTKREASDRKRDELLAAEAALVAQGQAEARAIEQEYESVAKTADGIRTEIEACRKTAETAYEAREASIRKTQVHRIATTVEIIRGWIKGERPMSIKLTARERGDLLTDQISMVRIWVYPVLAFIVAFLPTLMVEIGFSTVFEPEKQRPQHRLGFLGQHLHQLYIRAGRQKMMRAERLAGEASAQIASRDRALVEKEKQLQAAGEALKAASAQREEECRRQAEEHAAQLKAKEERWVAKLASMADSLNRTVIEKDALKDLQKSEIERQVQMRQNAWSDRLTQLRQELDDQRAAAEAERLALMEEHHQKLLEVSEESKNQVIQARRQAAAAELAAMESAARLNQDLKAAMEARDIAEAQRKQQEDSFALKLAQAKEEAAREAEKALRQEKLRFERQQLEFGKTLRQREEDFAHQLKQREQELNLAFDARLAEEQARAEQSARRREAELQREYDVRALEMDARWKQDSQQREETAQTRAKQREQQLQAQADARLNEARLQAEQELRRAVSDLERQFEAQTREAGLRFKQELQQKELSFQTTLKQREQELAINAGTRETELQKQWASELRTREEEWERQAEARVRAVESRLAGEAQQKEELFASRLRQNEQQWQVKLESLRSELQAQQGEAARRQEEDAETRLRDLEAQLRREIQQKEEALQARTRKREQELETQFAAHAEARLIAGQALWQAEAEKKLRAAVEPLKAQLARVERERDEALQASVEGARQAQHLEQRLTEASLFLSGGRNGRSVVEVD